LILFDHLLSFYVERGWSKRRGRQDERVGVGRVVEKVEKKYEK